MTKLLVTVVTLDEATSLEKKCPPFALSSYIFHGWKKIDGEGVKKIVEGISTPIKCDVVLVSQRIQKNSGGLFFVAKKCTSTRASEKNWTGIRSDN